MARMIFIISILFVFFSGCGHVDTNHMENGALSFCFDATGNYTGFSSIRQDYTIEQAIEEGCYVRKNGSEAGGINSWGSFIESANDGNESGIRIMHIFDDITYYSDLYCIDGSYRVFDSSSEDLSDHKYKSQSHHHKQRYQTNMFRMMRVH